MITSLLPFVSIIKGGAAESTVQRALQILRADEQLSQLEIVMAFFATFVLDSALVQQIIEQLEVIKRRFKTLNTLDELHELISNIQTSSTQWMIL